MNKTIFTLAALLVVQFTFSQIKSTKWDDFGNVPRNSAITPMPDLPAVQDANEWLPAGPYGGDVLDVAVDPTNPDRGFAAAGYPYIRVGEENPWVLVESLTALSPNGIHCIEINSNGTMFAAGNYSYGKVFISTDGGESWMQKNIGVSAGVLSLTVDPSDPNTVYATTTGIFGSTQSKIVAKSTDEGSSWTLLDLTSVMPGGYGCVALAVDPGAPQTLMALGSEGISNAVVALSTDGGSTWQSAMGNLPTGKPLNAIKISSGDTYICGGQLFGGNVMGVYKSGNFGTTWSNISSSFPNKVANDILINPDNPDVMYVATEGDGVYFTMDAGQNWTFNTSGAGDNGSVRKLAFNPANYQFVVAGYLSLGVCYSSDGGSSWVSATEGISALTLNDVESDPNNPGVMLASFEAENSGGCYIFSDDAWSLVEGLPATRFSAVDIGYDGTMYAWSNGPTTVAAEGVYKSSDGGATWENMGPNIGSVFETQIWTIAISENDPDLIFIGGNNFGANGWASMIYRSADGGENWENTFMGPDNDAFRFIHLVPGSDDMDVYAAYKSESTGGFLKSIDNGTNWLPINDGLPATVKWCGSIVSDPQNSDILYGGVGGYGGVPGTVYKSEDAGSSWNAMSITLGNYSKVSDLVVSPDNSNVVYAATTMDGVYITSDGSTWEPASEGLPATNVTGFSRVVETGDDDLILFAATATNSAYWTDVYIPSTTGFSKNVLNPVVLFPNPATDQLKIALQEDQGTIENIKITSLAGQVVFQQYFNRAGLYEMTISPDLKPGIYLLSVKSYSGTQTEKLVIR